MPHYKRNKKRRRNKSSPQTVSVAKKYRQTDTVSENLTDITDNSDIDTEAEIESVTEVEAVTDQKTPINSETINESIEGEHITKNMAEEFHEQDMSQMSQSILNTEGGAPQFVNVDQGAMQQMGMQNPMSIDPHLNQHMMNMAQMQQMQRMPHPLAMQQQHVQQPQSLLTEEDVLRIVLKMKEVLRSEIRQMVEHQVALKTETLTKEVSDLRKDLTKAQADLKNVTIRNDDLEQYSRRSCLRISGIKEDGTEDTTQLVLNLAGEVGADTSIDDIDRSHRVGRFQEHNAADDSFGDISDEPEQPFKSREIIVKFKNYDARLKLLKGRATLREKKRKVYINEDLTKTRKNISYECRKLKKDSRSKVSRTWVFNGNVFILDDHDNKIRIACLDDLDPYRPPDENARR